MQRIRSAAGLLVVMVASIGCDSQSPEFALPEGDIASGQALFVSMNCTSCHTVRGLDLPQAETKGPVNVSLGGKVSEVKSYSQLVTSVINPSHELVKRRKPDEVSVDGESLMTIYNDTMTVSQMIDIVAFLDSRYEEFERPKVKYRTR